MKKIIKIILILIILLLLEPFFCRNINIVYGEGKGWAGGAEDFLGAADSNIEIKPEQLNDSSSEIYNILTSIGMIAAVVVGVVLGIQYMFTSAEEKAKVLETILPYIIGCVITFGAFGIWKLLINTLYNI